MQRDDDWIPATLRATRMLTPGIREFTLAPDAGAAAYAPGAHLRIQLQVNGRPAIRHYSLVGARPQDSAWRIAVQREDAGRGGSRAMWALEPGDRLTISRPRSHFDLAPGAPEILLLAGGIGITPLIGMAEALLRQRARFRLLYAGRSRGSMAYLPELGALLGDALVVRAEDEAGRPDLRQAFAELAPGAEAYVCGPIGLLEAARRAWSAAGRPSAGLVFETFGSSGHADPRAFTVRIPRLGRDIDVPADGSMLEALEAAGIGVLSDCRRGECGLCAVDVLAVEGRIDHRDVFFSDRQHGENRRLCACVSRVVGNSITIDPPWRGDAPLAPGRGPAVASPA
ncbi:PDR/VanB family oxidoreductase [Falsiroseomonas stagni]|uniref:Vanillate demethylase subunit B n=1 Tax=Falsiroseomonas stagni DSM 19981 TaxID=1123062 RepID=A0A1I4FFD4_9PROT|nr:PDR/VanB family oxidoreductase [Falsiroseomonas stagni]SFL16695.1 vanillate demethylase subunit B [Falsiroseomonas stagni DSM 19981]